MNLYLGMEDESYKYVFGAVHKFAAPFDENKAVALVCGRNDRAAAQLLLYSDDELLVCVNKDVAFYERGPIDIARVSVAVPGLNDCKIGVNLIGLIEDDDRQLKSDILLRQTSIRVERRRAQPVWIELEIGPDAEPGTYYPEVTVYTHRMFEAEKKARTLTFEVKVEDVKLRAPADYAFYLDLWQHNSNIARKYDVELWGEAHFSIMEFYVSSLAELGQKAITVIVSEIPWSGQFSCLDRIDPANMFEYNIVGVTLRSDGEWAFDFGALNRYIELCMKHGIDREIEVFGLLNIWVIEEAGYGAVIPDHGDAVRIRYYEESSGTYKYMSRRSELAGYIAALERNFQERGWTDKVRILADEPADLDKFRSRLSELRTMAPSFQYKVAINHAEFMREDGILDYVPLLDCAAGERELISSLRKEGKALYYVCCGPAYPNTFIMSPLLESRLIPWLTWEFGLDGFLRWNYTTWPNDPLNKIVYHAPIFPAGDTNFVYPGRDGKPLLSLRYKLLQKGIRDYEIFRRYVELGGDRATLAERMRRVFLWNDIKELRSDSRKTREELYSLQQRDYEEMVGSLLADMAKMEQ